MNCMGMAMALLLLIGATAEDEEKAEEQILFEGMNWTVVDDPSPSEPSGWVVENGALMQLSNIYRKEREFEYWQGTHIVAGSPTWGDYELSFKINSSDDDGIGAIVRYRDADDYYRYIMVQDGGNGGPFRRLERLFLGERTILAEDGQGYIPGQTYDIRFKAEEEMIEVWLDGERVLSASDDSIPTGMAGFLCYASAPVAIWNVSIIDPTGNVLGGSVTEEAIEFEDA